MIFQEVVSTSQRVAATSSRRGKIELLAALLRGLEPSEIAIAIGFLIGWPRQGKLGVGWASVRDAVKDSDPAAEPTLEIAEVDQAFERLVSLTGKGSAASRAAVLRELLARATREERDFLVRLIGGEVRHGALEGVLAEAVAGAARASPDSVRRAAMFAGDLGVVAVTALTEGPAGLDRFRLELFRPIQPMLADSAENVEAALAALGNAALEYKLDGARVQVHKRDGEVRIYSRNLNEVTASVPEVVEAVRGLPARELVLDGEVIALNAAGRPYPFQVTMSRFGRRLEVDHQRVATPLTPFFFDLLLVDGEELLDRPLTIRSERLIAIVPDSMRVARVVTDDLENATAFSAAAIAAGHEGLMAKALGASYAAGRRGSAWLKIKSPRTLDLVILAAEWGSGRRQGWLSNLHLGARDPNGGFVMLGKTFKGMTDEMLGWQTEALLARETHRDGQVVYVRPELVVEVAFNEIQASSQYPGGLTLRFARVKGYRPDKPADQADTIETIRAMYRADTASPSAERI